MKNKPKSIRCNFTLDKETVDMLKVVAQYEFMSMSQVLRQLIRKEYRRQSKRQQGEIYAEHHLRKR